MNPRGKDLEHFSFREPNFQMFRTKQASLKSPFTLFASAGEKFSELYQQNEIRDFEFFLDQATPGFELGKKDLQSPALPLGHAAKMYDTLQNR